MNEKYALMRILGFLDSLETYTEIHKLENLNSYIKAIRIRIETIIEEENCEL